MARGALDKQILPGVFARGLNTGKDPKLVGVDLIVAENAVFDREGAISKRTATVVASSLPSEKFITSYKDRPVVIDEESLKVYDGTAFDSGATSHKFADIDVDVLSSVKGALYFYPDIAILSGITCIVFTRYKQVAGTYTYVPTAVTFDSTTGLVIDTQELANASSTTVRHARCLTVGTSIVIYYVDVTTHMVCCYTVDGTGNISASPTAVGTAAGKLTGANDFAVALCGDAGNTVVACFLDASDDVRLEAYTGGTSYATGTTLAGTRTFCSCFTWDTDRVCVCYFDTAGTYPAMLYRAVDHTLNTTIAETESGWNGSGYNVLELVGCKFDSTRAYIWFTVQDGTHDYVVMRGTFSTGAAVTTPAEHIRRVRIASQPFGALGDPSLLVHYASIAATGEIPTQAAYFLVDVNGRVIGKALVGRAGPYAPAAETILGHASNAVASSGTYLLGALVRTSTGDNPWKAEASSPWTTYDDIGFCKLTVTRGAPSSLLCAERSVLHIPNSNPYQWDGQALAEQGFLQYPEGLSSNTSSSGTLSGTYGYAATYNWTDAQGNAHVSAPSPVLTVTATSKIFKITVPTLTLTRKTGVKITLWRTLDSGPTSQMYRHSDKDNSTTSESVTFEDQTADASLSNKSSLYTSGGALRVVQPQPYAVHAFHQGRHFTVDRERPGTVVWYTRACLDGEAPPYSNLLALEIPEEGGDITALVSFADRLLVFKATRIWVVTGEGESDNGAPPGYGRPELVSPAIGCTSQKTTARIPGGVAFLSQRGLYLLSEAFQISYIGKRVQWQTDTLTIAAATVIPPRSTEMYDRQGGIVIWTTDSDAIVYNFLQDQWATWTGFAGRDAAECGGILYWTGSSSKVYRQNTSSFLDEGTTSIILKLRTGWISPTQLLAWSRVYRVLLVGQNISSHTLRLKTASDMEPATVDSLSFAAAGFTTSNLLAQYSAWSGTYTDKGYVLEAYVKPSRRTAIALEICDEENGAAIDEAYSITGFALVVGAKPDKHKHTGSARRMA